MGGLFANGRGRGLLYLGGCAALFLGERMLATRTGVRMGLAVVAALAVVGSLAMRFKDIGAHEGRLAMAMRPLLIAQGLSAVGLILYALQVDAARQALGLVADVGAQRDLYGVALAVIWPIVWLAGATTMVLLDRAAEPMRLAGEVEPRRISEAWRAGLSIGLAVAFLFVANLLTTRHDEKVDLAYYRTARPGTAAVALVKKLEAPVHVYLFFPKANDVLEQVEGYFAELAAHSDNLKVEVADRLLRPGLAKEYQVRQDGTVVVAREAKKERWRIGTKLTSARRDLAKLDGELHKRLSKVAAPQRFAYLVTGHGEVNNPDRSEDSLAKSRDKGIRKVLEWQGYSVKTLGLAQGLGSKVPDDAGVVLVLGPQDPLLPEEQESLAAYVEGGGRLLLAVEPLAKPTADALLGRLGLKHSVDVLTHDKVHLRRRFDASDRQLLPTNSFSSHASVRSLSRDSRHLALVVDRSGHLERHFGEGGAKGRKIEMTVRTMTGTWADKDGDRQLGPNEQKRVRHVAAAVTTPEVAPKEGDGDKVEGRALVLADADAVADSLMGNRGNVVMLSDALRWLQGEEDLAGTVESEEDVAVEHTKEEDAIWFHGTVFVLPLVVLMGGLGYVRRRRRAGRPGGEA